MIPKSNMKFVRTFIFILFFIILLIDRTNSLTHFGFVYTDIDQLILWNGALDYSNGTFHEPFFYGQPYNFMLEAIVAVPLLHLNIPVYIALPIATSLIVLLPFIILGLILFAKQKYFWAYLCLAVPVFLPLQFNFLTMISRGFVQAHFFIPFLFIPLFDPKSKRSVTILYLATSVCFITNQSSILIALPVIAYVSRYHIGSTAFYLKSLWVIPFLLLDFLLKLFYKFHPEKVVHTISGIRLDGKTFVKSFGNNSLFEYLHPFSTNGGFVYALIFGSLALIAWRRARKNELVFIISVLCIILISLAIPKVQGAYPVENAGIFFSSSRFYLALPLLVIISAYLVFRDYDLRKLSIYLLLGFCLLSVLIKNSQIRRKVNETVMGTSFPITQNQKLLDRAKKLKTICTRLDVDLIVYKMLPSWDWSNLYDSYALHPLTNGDAEQEGRPVSVNLNGDRRTWLYENSKLCKRILLVGFNVDEDAMKPFEYAVVGDDYILINNNNSLNTKTLFQRLNYEFGPQRNNNAY